MPTAMAAIVMTPGRRRFPNIFTIYSVGEIVHAGGAAFSPELPPASVANSLSAITTSAI